MLSQLLPLGPEIWHDHAFMEPAFETLLSASKFRDWPWKKRVIRHAQEVARLFSDPINTARVTYRSLQLERLYSFAGSPPDYPPVHIEPTNKRSNAFLGQLGLMRAQTLVDNSDTSEKVRHTVQAFRPLDPASASFHENHVLLEGQFLYGKALQFEGRFDEAATQLSEAHDFAKALVARSVVKIGVQYSDVQCERGHYQEAIRFLETDVRQICEFQHLENGYGKRVVLALANAHLMKALDAIKKTGLPDFLAVKTAEDKFKWLDDIYKEIPTPGFTVLLRIFSISCGLAMVYHVRGELLAAKAWWEKAEDSARRCWPDRGYAFLITTYSQSQLAFRLQSLDAEKLYDQARDTWLNMGRRRQHYFIGLGTVWPDLLGDWEDTERNQRLMNYS